MVSRGLRSLALGALLASAATAGVTFDIPAARTYLSPKGFSQMTADDVGPGSGVSRDYY